jgi:Family of unknown function (DUF6291)
MKARYLVANGKKSFIAYCSWMEIFDELSDEEAGQLVKHLFKYVNDLDPVCEDKLIRTNFISIRQSLKRDLKKWDKYIEKQTINGQKGGRPKKPKETQETQAFILKPKKADSVSDSVNASTKEQFMIFKSLISEEAHVLWRESLYMKHKLKPQTLELILDKFIIHLLSTEKEHNSIQEFKSHFLHWCNRIEPEGKIDQYKKQHEVIDTNQRI